MDSNPHIYNYDGNKPFTLIKWKTKVGSQLLYNSVILSYKYDDVLKVDGKDPLLKYKSNIGGTVVELFATEGETVHPGAQLLKIQPCTHPVIMKDLCAECGTDLRHLDRDNFEKLTAATTFSMVHVVPELKVCLEQAEKLGRDDENRLLKNKKLVLLVDLDQTLIHTTNDSVLKDLPDVHHFQLYGPNSPWYHTKLRPGTQSFLQNIAKYYELHICTFGARLYAHKIAQILDPDGKLFSHRILSRDECFDATSKTGNLKALFPRGDDMVCIIDDREDVWNFAPNVVHVKPYCYFHNTGDINAPSHSSRFDSKDVSSVAKVVKDSNNTVVTKVCDKGDLNKQPVQNEVNENEMSSEEDSEGDSTIKETNKESTKNKENSNCSKINVEGCISNENIAANDKSILNNSDSKSAANITSIKALSSDFECKGYQSDELKTDEMPPETNLYHELQYADDYLLYLEEILQNIHKEYYERYNKMKSEGKKKIPDLKVVVPEIRRKILKGCSIVFSSVIPTNLHPETSRFWTLAESLGASVSLDVVSDSTENRTTHIVASKQGTAKVNVAKRYPHIFIVSLDWLFCCAERWDHVDERLFPLKRDITPPFLDGTKTLDSSVENSFYDPTMGKSLKGWPASKQSQNTLKRKNRKSRKDDEQFSERIFVEAGLSLSQDDIDDMGKEVEDACSEDSEKESSNSSSDSSSEESLSAGDYPKGWKRPRKDIVDVEVNDGIGESSDADTIGSVDEEIAEAVKQEFGS